MKEEFTPLILNNGLVIKASRVDNSYLMALGMAFVTGDNKKVSAFVSCRDYLHDSIRTKINNNKRLMSDGHSYRPELKDPDICMDRLRLLISFKSENLKKFKMGLKALNDMEIYANNIEKTVGEIVKLEGKINGTITYVLLKGSKEYMDIPHLLSLITLTLRFFISNPKMNYKAIGDLPKVYKDICKANTIRKDKLLMASCYSWMHHILKHRAELFANKTQKELYPTSITHNFHGKGGMMELCNANSPNEDVNERIIALKKRYKEES